MKQVSHLNPIVLTIMLAMVLLSASSCRNGRSSEGNDNTAVNTKLDHDVDSIIYMSTTKLDEGHTLHLIDSFQNAGRLNPMWADALRARRFRA